MLKYVVIFLLVAFPARALEIDFSQPVADLTGPALDCNKESVDGKCIEVIPMTLGRLCGQALAANRKNESLANTLQRGILARKVFSGAKLNLTVDEVTIIKNDLILLGARTSIIADAVTKLDPTAIDRETKQ